MIRYYELVGLTRDLLRLWSHRDRSSVEVKAIALQHAAALKERATHLNELANALKHLALALGREPSWGEVSAS